MTMNIALPRQPGPVALLVDRMAGFFPQCKQVVSAWESLEEVRGFMPKHLKMPDTTRPELPDDLTDHGEFYKWQCDNRKALKPEMGVWAMLLQWEDALSFEVRLWRGRLDDVHSLICTVKPWMDDQNLPAYKRWSGHVSAVLQRMSGLISRFDAFDAPTEFDKACFIECFGALWKRFRELKRVVGEPPVDRAAASSAPTAAIAPAPELVKVSTEVAAVEIPLPTQKELIRASGIKETKTPEISATLFRELVVESGITPTRVGGKGRRFSRDEVRALIETATRLGKQCRDQLAKQWARFASPPLETRAGDSEMHGKAAYARKAHGPA